MVNTTANQHDLSTLVDEIHDLPSFPAAIQRATALSQDPKATATDLAAVIQVDPALTAKILRITNSAFYGLSREISTVKEGVVILGFSAVRSLAVAVSAMKMFTGGESTIFSHEVFWRHSTCSAMVAQQISRLGRLPGSDEAFTAGLLHDIGKIVLDQYAHQEFILMLVTLRREAKYDFGAERRVINTTHAEIGRQLVERWGLPEPLCEAIDNHHTPGRARKQPMLAMLAAVADYICSHNGVPSVANVQCPPAPSNALNVLKLAPSVLKDVQKQFPDIRVEAEKLIQEVK